MADEFQTARSIYNARKRLSEKADRLLDEASPRVRAIVSSLEEEDASKPIELVPSPNLDASASPDPRT